MHENHAWIVLPALVVPAGLAAPAYAVQYLTVEEAQQALFPDAKGFVSQPVLLTAAQKAQVEKYAGVRMRAPEQPVWRVESDGKPAGWFVLDEVYGKHEFITYAVALDADGNVTGLEILDYRETHGGEVREPTWRELFRGKKYGDALKLDEDIPNISGATLSCKHITEGVRRVLGIYQAALRAQ